MLQRVHLRQMMRMLPEAMPLVCQTGGQVRERDISMEIEKLAPKDRMLLKLYFIEQVPLQTLARYYKKSYYNLMQHFNRVLRRIA